MKKLTLIGVFIWIFLVQSCKEEPIGQYPIDNIAPHQVTNVVVQNLKGRSVLTYDLPKDDDMLCVKAVYNLPDGTEKTVVASAFVNSLVVDGFARRANPEVKLISVDRSWNESEPVKVKINPSDSPIFDIFESLHVISAFGGIKANWKNDEQRPVVVGVIYKDEDNIYKELENFYTTMTEGVGTIRGMKPEETEFGLFVRDVYKNYTDTLFIALTPWEEQALDTKLFREMPLCNRFLYSSWAPQTTSTLWDGIVFRGGSDQNLFALNAQNNPSGSWITIDFGVAAKLSRFRFWQREDFYFNLSGPKIIEIWGTDDPDVAYADACGWDDWQFLGAFESWKPSGPDPVPTNQLTSEDLARAQAGEEFEFELDIPSVRFVRFYSKKAWGGGVNMQMVELRWWGQPIK